ncbi:MAG: hypothetical protein WD032_05325 [Nitrospirales bacterium]
MKKDLSAQLVFRYSLENPGAVIPDEETEGERHIAQTGEQQEQTMLEPYTPVPKGASIQAERPFLV